MSLHTSMKTGARVLVILKNGTQIIDKFKKAGSKAFELERGGRIQHKCVRSLTYYRESPQETLKTTNLLYPQ